MGRTAEQVIVWEPQAGPQTSLVTCPVFEVLFGGARGGGKTDGMLGDFAIHAQEYGKQAIGLMVRRTREELKETIERSYEIYGAIGAEYKTQDKMWSFPNGARLRFAYLENDKDAESYQGHSYTRVYVEEMGNFPNEKTVMKLMATLRSAHGVPVGFRATANPGGVGHAWIKARYIDHAPQGLVVTKHSYDNPITGGKVERDRVFIPSRLKDNKLLVQNDPGYVANLQMQGSPELVRAWLEGDWNVVAGAAFEKLSRDKHMIRSFDIPYWWTRWSCLDWGTAKPYAVGWYTVCDQDLVLKAQGQWPERLIAKGSIIRYRELYGWNGNADQGTREESWQVARKIHEAEAGEPINYRIADSAMWAEHDGPSAAARMQDELRRLDNKCPTMEQSRKDRKANYLELRNRISGVDGEAPGFYTFPNSTQFWRTVPELQLDEKDPEKGWDTRQEDHVCDEWGYAMVSWPLMMDQTRFDRERYDDARERAFEAERGVTGRSYSRYS